MRLQEAQQCRIGAGFERADDKKSNPWLHAEGAAAMGCQRAVLRLSGFCHFGVELTLAMAAGSFPGLEHRFLLRTNTGDNKFLTIC